MLMEMQLVRADVQRILAEIQRERQLVLSGLEDGRQVLADLLLMSETRATNALFCASPAPSLEDDEAD